MGDTEQTFLGEFEHTVDEKGRLTIPVQFRDKLAGKIFVTRGLDGCLFIFDQESWNKKRSPQHPG